MYLRDKIFNDEFHNYTFFPSVVAAQGHRYSQVWVEKDTNYFRVDPMKKESQSINSLKYFCRYAGIPHTIKSDNAKTKTVEKWTTYCRNIMTKQILTKPNSPWQNQVEHSM